MKTKQIFLPIIIIMSIVIGLIPQKSLAAEDNYDFYYQDFLVSAYYSPLPNQTRYLRGSYESDIRLNGRGTNGADGTEVYMGMLAAPKSYSFGTHIDLPGLGIGSVHDRGGAIKEKKQYHRIDVWMGYGDTGLSRALNWGMRYITGKVYFETNILTDSLNYNTIAANTPSVTKKKKIQKNISSINKNLSPRTIDSQVVKLKELLKQLGYFSFETQNNYYGENLSNSIARFQKAVGIIDNMNSYGAGYFGLKTRESLNKAIEENNIIVKNPQEKNEVQQKVVQAGIEKNSSEIDVKNLQNMLNSLGYFKDTINGKHSENLITAIFAFQKDNNIVTSPTQTGAGYFGPKTKKALQIVLKKRQEKLAQFPITKSQIINGEKKEVEKRIAIIPQNISFPQSKSKTFTPTSMMAQIGADS